MTTRGYFRFVREERQFCAVLAHLLMQKSENLRSFVSLVDGRGGQAPRPASELADDAEVYLEFALLRDQWNSFGRDNERKRAFIGSLMSKVSGISHYRIDDFPEGISDFNEMFMGPSGQRVTRDISNPGRWRVEALCRRFGAKPSEFWDFCRFKWAFNIKPDIVLLTPGSRPLCIEAKLETKEQRYPTKGSERKIFDDVFGSLQGRVGQVELQRFMFDTLLGEPCRSLVIARDPAPGVDLTWQEVFGVLDLGSSLQFVQTFVEENRHLRPRGRSREKGRYPDSGG